MVKRTNVKASYNSTYVQAADFFNMVLTTKIQDFKPALCLLEYYYPVAMMIDAGNDSITFRLAMISPIKDCPLAIDVSIGVIKGTPPVVDFNNQAGRPLQTTPADLAKYIKTKV